MTNFIFKSHGTYKKLAFTLERIQAEQKALRCDIGLVQYGLNQLLKAMDTDKGLQKQVTDYYGSSTNLEDGAKDIPDSTEI